MSKFAALVKFEFLTNSSRFKDDKLFSRVRRVLFTLIGCGLLLALFVYAVNIILNVFVGAGIEQEFITIFVFFLMVMHLITGVGSATKVLFSKADLSILKLPVSGIEVFSAKFIYLYVKQVILALAVSLPVFIILGIKTAQGLGFFLMLVPNILFLPIIPLLFAILLSVPVMWLIKIFKTKYWILIILYSIVIVAVFIAYIYCLKFILHVLESGDFSNVFDRSTTFKIKQFTAYLYLPLLLKNLFVFYNYGRSLVINLALAAFLLALVYAFADQHYFNFLISSKNQKHFKKKTKEVKRSPAIALMSKEFKNIFRSTNYAFQYLTIVVTTPLMVFFSSQVASSIGAPMGDGILPGIIVLVLIMFLSMGTAFSATSITREGGNFFLTKIIPVKFSTQVFVKFFIYVLVSIPAIFISCFVLAFAKMLDYLPALLISISLSFVTIGSICYSILIDIKKPQFKFLENGEVSSSNKNISSSIGVGFIVSILMGFGGMVASYFAGLNTMYFVLFGFGVPYAAIEIFSLFFRLEKRYAAIEV